MMLLNFLRRVRQTWFRSRLPEMVSGWKNSNGVYHSDVRISNTTYIGNPERLKLAGNIFIGHFNFIEASNQIVIGEGCQITNYVSIITHSSHISIRLLNKNYRNFSDPPGYIKDDVAIGDYTFIGPHSVIMPGSKIGRGCIVSAFSYVQGEFPDFSIISGQPAKAIGTIHEMDEKWLLQFPELRSDYEMWKNGKH